MAKIVDNKKGFLAIEVSRKEMAEKLSGFGICDYCNQSHSNGYYVAVLNAWYCPICYESFVNRSVRYQEDKHIEERNFKSFASLLGLL